MEIFKETISFPKKKFLMIAVRAEAVIITNFSVLFIYLFYTE